MKHVKAFCFDCLDCDKNLFSRFISQLLTLLVCQNEHTALQMRNSVKESLGVDLSPALFKSFFTLCKATKQCFFPDGQVGIAIVNIVHIQCC